MKKVFFFLFFFASSSSASITVRDATGYSINLTHPATRIISLAPNLTEIFCEIDCEQQLIAKDKNSDFPSRLHIPILGDYYKLNLEYALALHPDLIAIEQSRLSQKDINMLRKLGIAVYVSHASSLLDVSKTMLDLGTLTGKRKIAEMKAIAFTNTLQSLRKKYQTTRKPIVFYQVWQNPLLTVNNKTIINDIITLCGGLNPANDFLQSSPAVSVEYVIKQNPDIILSSSSGFQTAWQRFTMIKAVRNNRLYFIAPDLIQRPGPRLLQGIKQVCTAIHEQP